MTRGAAVEMGDDAARAAFYRGALVALRFLESKKPTGRRFGPDADARWAAFAGGLELVDRMELLIRDADAEWPGAFGARMVFALETVAEDDAFGPEWPGLHPPTGARVWRDVLGQDPPADPRATLEEIARAWEISLAPTDPGTIGPADPLVIAGPAAVTATVEAFAANPDLDWSEQVTCVATPPGHRQLAALGAALTPGVMPARLLRAGSDATPPRTPPRLVLSDDADPADAAAARRLAGEEA